MTSAHNPLVDQLCAFLTQIGLETRERALPDATFLPGLLIQNGVLWIDPDRLRYPGDILHEAGHLAVSTPLERRALAGNIMDDRPDKAGDEIAVLLWSYAACLHLALDPHVVFHPDGYRGEGAWLVEQFTGGNYIGLPLLVWMGLAQPPAPDPSAPGFPIMKQWLRS